MVKTSGFIAGVTTALDLPETTIAGAYRVLRESGLMTSGARGVNAPDMTYLDAARILIAMLVSERPAYAESGARDFGGLVCIKAEPAGERNELEKPEFNLGRGGLGHRHTFEQALTELIRMYGEDKGKAYFRGSHIKLPDGSRFEPGCAVVVEVNRLQAEIVMMGNHYFYEDPLVAIEPEDVPEGTAVEQIEEDPDAEAAHELKRSRYATAIRSIRSVHAEQIAALARMIRDRQE